MNGMQFLAGHFNYIVVIILMMTGLYIVISTGNMVKKLTGLGVFQTSVFQLYITMGKVTGGRPPIVAHAPEGAEHAAANGGEHGASTADTAVRMVHDMADVPVNGVIYSNPIPHVLILTGIVVGVATLAVGLALIVRIRETYDSIEEEDVEEAEYKARKAANA